MACNVCTFWNYLFVVTTGIMFCGTLYTLNETVILAHTHNITKITYNHDVGVFAVHTCLLSILFVHAIVLICRNKVLNSKIATIYRHREIGLLPE